MKRLLTAVAVLAVAAVAHGEELRGTWTASPSSRQEGKLHFTISREPGMQNGQTRTISEFQGLTEAQVASTAQTPVQFRKNTEAGLIEFEGLFRNREGAGHFRFTPNPSYFATMRSMGIEIEEPKRRRHRSESEDLLTYAMHDVSVAFVKSLKSAGYDLSLHEYLEASIFRVTPEVLTQYRQLGFGDLDFKDVLAFRIHGVTPEFIREMRSMGHDLKAREYVAFRIHRVTPEFIRELQRLGYRDMDDDDLVSARIHRVTPQFISEMKDAGYDLSLKELASMSIHRVTPEYISELAALGYRNVDSKDLVSARIHRVTPEYIRELQASGYSNIPLRKLISMRIHGVDADFAKKMNGTK